MRIRSFGLLLFISVAACAPRISREDKVFLDKMKVREQARADLERTPSHFIQGGDWTRYDKGWLNDYTRATAIEFTNRSGFDVSDIRGKVTYISPTAEEMAIVPFSASGELRAGQQVMLTVHAGEISGKATKARVTVEYVRVHR